MPIRDISVCIITCNQERYIRHCLDSVLAQNRTRLLEILVADDHSDDRTGDILREYTERYPEWIRGIHNPRRLGASENLKRLWGMARGAYLAHLDGDDFWLPGKLELQADFMDRHPECSAIYTNARTVLPNDENQGLFNDARAGMYDLAALFRRGNFLNTSSMLLRRPLAQPVIDTKKPFIDFHIHLLLAQQGLLAQLDRVLVGYRVHAEGAMTRTSGDLVRELYWEAMLNVPPERLSRSDKAHGMADFLCRIFMTSRRMKRWELFRAWLPRIRRASPCSGLTTAALTLFALIRRIMSEGWDRIRRRFGCKVEHVLFRR